jgi:hypothetical protein
MKRYILRSRRESVRTQFSQPQRHPIILSALFTVVCRCSLDRDSQRRIPPPDSARCFSECALHATIERLHRASIGPCRFANRSEGWKVEYSTKGLGHMGSRLRLTQQPNAYSFLRLRDFRYLNYS